RRAVKCGGVLSSRAGHVRSPRHPAPYPALADCLWLLVAPAGARLTLAFSAFSLEPHPACAYDALTLWDGQPGTAGALRGRYCGERGRNGSEEAPRPPGVIPPAALISSGHVVGLQFHSDKHVSRSGFLIAFDTEDCGGPLSGPSGSFASPAYPSHYPNGADCVWALGHSAASVTALAFRDLLLEEGEGCGFDYVAVYAGGEEAGGDGSERCFNGTDLPTFVSPPGRRLLVVFHSDYNIGARGFLAEYHTDECQRTLTALQGDVHSPRYPGPYPGGVRCRWLLAVPPPLRLRLSFRDFHLEESDERGHCGYDQVALFDGETENENSSLGRFCGSRMPPATTSTSSKLLITMHTDSSEALRGFSLSYTAVVPMTVACGESGFRATLPTELPAGVRLLSARLRDPACSSAPSGSTLRIEANYSACRTKEATLRNKRFIIRSTFIFFYDLDYKNDIYYLQYFPLRFRSCHHRISFAAPLRCDGQTRRPPNRAAQQRAAAPTLDGVRSDDTSGVLFITICVLACVLMFAAAIAFFIL
uniref:CUB domain-containing protein n=1 Tax=Petromyzon marinus TaxID=7757 RepID=S4RS02_PETMA